MDAYLRSSRRRARAFQRRIRYKRLRTPVGLLLSNSTASSIYAQWKSVAKTRLILSEAEHLALVRYPVPPEVSLAITDS